MNVDFPTGFFWVWYTCSTTVCTTGRKHTLTCCTHIFLLHSLSAHIRTSSYVCTQAHGSSVCKKVFAHVSFLCFSLFSLLMSHPSLLFPRGHFETSPDYGFTDDPVHMFLPYLPVLKAQDTRNSAPASRSLAAWPSQMQTQVVSPTSSTRSLLWTVTRCSLTI